MPNFASIIKSHNKNASASSKRMQRGTAQKSCNCCNKDLTSINCKNNIILYRGHMDYIERATFNTTLLERGYFWLKTFTGFILYACILFAIVVSYLYLCRYIYIFSPKYYVMSSSLNTQLPSTFVSKALWYRIFKQLDCSLIWNFHRMYQSIHSSNSAYFMKK